MNSAANPSEFVFFDVETTIPTRSGQGYAILEFGAILVSPINLKELGSFSTLIKPSDLSLITSRSIDCNGITIDHVISAPTFCEVSDRIYDLLHERIWVGHNILRFDCARIREAFVEIGKPVPEPKGTIDSLPLLTNKFGRRAGNMKMDTLAVYFDLGQQVHRSLDDVRLNLEILKYCATVLFLESSLPDIFTENSWISPNATKSTHNQKSSPEGSRLSQTCETLSSTNQRPYEYNPSTPTTSGNIGERILNLTETSTFQLNSFDMSTLSNEFKSESFQPDITMAEISMGSTEISSTPITDGCSAVFVNPAEVSVHSLSADFIPFYCGSQSIKIFHRGTVLQLLCDNLKVRFGISKKFVDHAGRPRINFVVEAPQSLCMVLDACDDVAQRLSVDSGSSSEWNSTVIRKSGFLNSPTVRLSILTVVNMGAASYHTEIYQKVFSGSMQKLVFNGFDVSEIERLFVPKTSVDAYFTLDPYDYQQNAGIRLVAKKLILN